MKKLRVFHIVPALSKNGGGIADAVLNLCQAQIESGLDVSVYGRDFSYPVDNYKIKYETLGLLSLCKLCYELAFDKSDSINKTVLHIHGAWSFIFVYVSILLLIVSKKIRVVYQGHGLLASNLVSGKSYYKKMVAWYSYQRNIFRRANVIIATSKKEVSDFSWCSPEASQLVEIPLGISDEFFEPLNRTTIQTTSLLFMSQIIPVKGLETLISAINRLKKECGIIVCLDIYGYGEPGYIESLKVMVINLGLAEQVRFLGAVDRGRRARLFDRYGFFILPSKNESFGLVVLEALSRGCKVLTTINTPWSTGIYKEFVDVIRLDESSLILELQKYQRELSFSYADEAVARHVFVRDKFDWKDICAKITSEYKG